MSEFMLQERQAEIYDRLRQQGKVVAASLAVEFGVSEDTIRRDLREMAASGLCERVYGGALLPASGPGRSLVQRMAQDMERKRKLAKAVLPMIEAEMAVYFDAGSTNLAIAESLPDDLRLTAITNAPAIAAALLLKPEARTILIGGMLNRQSGGTVGAKALADIAVLSPDLCLLGACGLHPQDGLTAFDFEDAEMKRAIARRSRKTVTAVTREKLGASAPYSVLPLERCHAAVVEPGGDAALLAALATSGCSLVVAPS